MDDDSLSRRAADFTAEWNWRTTIERLNESRTPQGGGYSGGGGGGGGSSAGAGTAIVAVLVISAIAGGFGGLSWFLGALMLAGGLVLFVLAVGWLVHLARRPSGRVMGFGATVLLATLGGGAFGTLVPTLLGGDIPMQEGVAMLGGLGALIGVVVGAVRAFLR
jgi:hypothetical protein